MRKYKILFCCNSHPNNIGGAEKVCKNAVDILSEKYDVTVLTQPYTGRKMDNVVELQGKTVYSYMPELAKYIDTHDFDLYISFGYGKYFTDYIGQWTKTHNKKSIVMPCGFFHTSSNAIFKKIYSLLVTKKTLNNYSCRITATEWEKDFWVDTFGVDAHNTFVIPYNLEDNFTKYKSTNILKKYGLKKKNYLLYLGRAGPNKLVQLLKDSYNMTDKKIPLVIAGKGNEEFNYLPRNELKLMNITSTERIKIHTNMNILSMGSVSEDDKKTLISNAKLVIFPSSYESFGMCILESIALRTPVIGSNIEPFKEILHNQDYLFENNVNDLARKLSRSYDDEFILPKIQIENYKHSLLTLVDGIRNNFLPQRCYPSFFDTSQYIFNALKCKKAQVTEGDIVLLALIVLIICVIVASIGYIVPMIFKALSMVW